MATTSELSPSSPSGVPPASIDRRALLVTTAVLGIALLLVYDWLERLLPRGPQEFAYFPFMVEPLPFAPMRGFTFEQLARHVLRFGLLGPAFIALAVALAGLAPQLRPPVWARRRLMLLALTGFSVIVSALVMTEVLRGRAIVDDELTYDYQASLLAHGQLGETSVPPWNWEPFTIWTRVGATGKYLFGEPLVQTLGTLMGFPALLHLLLAPLALWAWYRALEPQLGGTIAAWAVALVGISPMFILTNALALSHTTTLTCFALAGLGCEWLRSGVRPLAGALLAGTALGFSLAVRPQVAVPFGAVIGIVALWGTWRRRQLTATGLLAASTGLWVALIALYDKVLSGSLTTLPWYLFKPTESFGFGDVGGIPFLHTPWTAIENLLVSLVRWNGWWLGWPLSLGLVLAWWVLGRPLAGARVWLAAGAALVALNFLYYSPGISETGPVYYFELLLPASIVGAHAIVRCRERWPQAASAVLIVHLALGTSSFLTENVARLHRLVETIHGPLETALTVVEPPALLIHENQYAESVRFGWVWSFPLRERAETDPIVTYPRGSAKYVQLLRQRYAGRQCWYYRYHPQTHASELRRCEEVEPLLARGAIDAEPAHVPSTAERMGLLDSSAAMIGEIRTLRQRVQQRREAGRSMEPEPP